MLERHIRELLDKKVSEPEFSKIFTVDLEVSSNGFKIAVFIDSDTGISFKDCQKISRYLEEELEGKDLVPEKYTLEVSSPGINRSLLLKRQYPKNIGRNIEVKRADDNSKIEGTLLRVNESSIVLEIKEKQKKGVKKKDLKTKEIEIQYDNIAKATVKISFK